MVVSMAGSIIDKAKKARCLIQRAAAKMAECGYDRGGSVTIEEQ